MMDLFYLSVLTPYHHRGRNQTGVFLQASQALYQLSYSNIDTQGFENYPLDLRILVTQHFLISKTRLQTLNHAWPRFRLMS